MTFKENVIFYGLFEDCSNKTAMTHDTQYVNLLISCKSCSQLSLIFNRKKLWNIVERQVFCRIWRYWITWHCAPQVYKGFERNNFFYSSKAHYRTWECNDLGHMNINIYKIIIFIEHSHPMDIYQTSINLLLDVHGMSINVHGTT